MNRAETCPKDRSGKDLREGLGAGAAPGAAPTGGTDPELARLLAAWGRLDPNTRAALATTAEALLLTAGPPLAGPDPELPAGTEAARLVDLRRAHPGAVLVVQLADRVLGLDDDARTLATVSQTPPRQLASGRWCTEIPASDWRTVAAALIGQGKRIAVAELTPTAPRLHRE